MQRLARDRTPLTLCPLSNVRLRVIADLKQHPIRTMMSSGLVVTLNSDDPAYFGGYVNENYRAVGAALSLRPAEVIEVARNGFVAAIMSETDRVAALARFDAVVATLDGNDDGGQ